MYLKISKNALKDVQKENLGTDLRFLQTSRYICESFCLKTKLSYVVLVCIYRYLFTFYVYIFFVILLEIG